jgi:hypothetical protein
VVQTKEMKSKRTLLLLFLVLVIAVIPLGTSVVMAATAYSVDWVSQFGSTSGDYVNAVATDGLGYVYASGYTTGAFTGYTFLGQQDAFIIKYNGAGGFEWVDQFGTNLTDRAEGVAGDSLGNSWVVGDTYGELVDGINFSGSDAFIRMYDSSGTAQWTDQFGTTNHCYARAVAVDSIGNSYVVGYVAASLDGQTFLNGYDAFIRKYNMAGVKQWTRQFGTGSSEYAYAVTVDGFGNAYVAGQTGGTFSGQTHVGLADAFVRMYNSTGDVQWTCQFGTTQLDSVEGIDVDSAGCVYAAGYTQGQFTGETRSGTGNDKDAFISKLNSVGTAVSWNRQFGTSVDDYAQGAAEDGMGNAFVAGYTDGVLPGQTTLGGQDSFVRQYDSTGTEQWTYQYGTMDGAVPGEDSTYSIATDSSGNVFASGFTNGQFPGFPDKSYDGFILKMAPPSPPPSQTWYLDNMTTGPVMEQTVGAQSGSVPLGGTTVTWLSDYAADSPVVFDAGTWIVYLTTTDLTGACEVTIGESDGTTLTGFDSATGTAIEGSLTINMDLGAVTVPQDHYLALQVTNSGTGSILTDGSSFLGAPSSTPSYPLPELATGILLAAGLAALGGLVLISRKRARAAALR